MILPNESYGTIKEGLWLIHHEDDQIIRIWGSFKNGQEKVYVNDELVSEKRNFRMKSDHTFKDLNGSKYNITLGAKFSRRLVKFKLIKNSKLIKTFEVQFSKPKVTKKVLFRFLFLIPISIIFAIIKIEFKLANWTYILLFFFVLIFVQTSFEKSKITVREEVQN